MTTKRVSLLAGAILGGILLVGTAGLVLAQGPTTSPSPSSTPGMSGSMMGGQGMGGGMGSGMMGGQGMGTMGGHMTGGQMPDMAEMHSAMGQNGTCDPETMESMHEQHQSTD